MPKLCFWQQLVRRDGGRTSQQLLRDYYLRLQIVEWVRRILRFNEFTRDSTHDPPFSFQLFDWLGLTSGDIKMRLAPYRDVVPGIPSAVLREVCVTLCRCLYLSTSCALRHFAGSAKEKMPSKANNKEYFSKRQVSTYILFLLVNLGENNCVTLLEKLVIWKKIGRLTLNSRIILKVI